ncbi:hypothetical protein KXD40_009004 [Peronospora effusa]|uniref:C2 NT-type domain-containing protein n=1 Tax=Peronospora effusa TaxID=542832 RepID=A0A3R7YX44_9STRA|nr:hypothetical protein DD237_005669 [Peronospora effusa]UIZ25230.1 hypothetical protein KXD40_009004 [Peronospora effusa]CAI5701295.1 unnamed protein product [Peronospora effusa]
MRRGSSVPYDNVGPPPTYKGMTGATTSRLNSTTILVNLDVFIHQANIGRDISPNDQDLIVLFRRNSKEVTSEPARWTADHCAVWNQHLNIQTSLLGHKKLQGGGTAPQFLKKEYEIVLVALPSHSAVALFSVDFATLVQLNASPQDRHKSFRVSPLKCRDLAATLEFGITWDLVQSPHSSQVNTAANMMLHAAPAGIVGLPPSVNKHLHTSKTSTPKVHTPRSRETNKSRRSAYDAASMSTRRTTTSLSSAGSERDLLEELSTSNCSDCRSAKRRLDRKEVQVLQLESFLKESQKRIDALSTENEELVIREKAETRNAAQQRALSLCLLQELETAVQFCNSQMSEVHDTTMLPQLELIERAKKFHEEVDLLHHHLDSSQSSQTPHGSQTTFDFRAETEAALQRNQRLQEQLEFLSRSMDYDSDAVEGSTRTHRAATDASGTTISSVRSGSVTINCGERPVALTMTQQLNNLERENFKLRAELEGALANAASALKKHSGGFPSRLAKGMSLTAEISETTSSSSREDIEEPENESAALLDQIREQHEFEAGRSAALELELNKAKDDIKKLKDQLEIAQNKSILKIDQEQPIHAPGFLDKMYADVGKAKLMLEDRVKQLDEKLASATEENGRLRNEIEELQEQKSDSQNEATMVESDARTTELERLLELREKELKMNEAELAQTKRQLQDTTDRARAGDSAKSELERELADVHLSLKMAQDATMQLEKQLAAVSSSTAPVNTTSTLFGTHYSAASDGTGHDELADVQKQLKLSKQEVMQLRFRSNQLESVNERLEEALKEKRTLEVKLTTLEGHLFEQRNRSINTDNNSLSLDAKNSAMLTEMQRDLDHKSAQLMIAEREVDHLRSQCSEKGGQITTSFGNIEDIVDKVKRFESEIACLCQRNDEQARRLEKLATRVTVAVHERDELEVIVQQMVTEMALLDNDVNFSAGARNDRSQSTPEGNEMEEKLMPRRVPSQSPRQTGKITDCYANAVAASSSRTSSFSTPGVSSSKVAQLVKNFSAHDDSSYTSSSGAACKESTKLELRSRKSSSTSHRGS